jgi:hypothetical protein
MTPHVQFPFYQYLYVVLGILISVILPLLRKKLPGLFGITSLLSPDLIAASTNVYIVVGLFSLLTAVLIVALGGSATSSWEWFTAILAGYAWDSTLQKIAHG